MASHLPSAVGDDLVGALGVQLQNLAALFERDVRVRLFHARSDLVSYRLHQLVHEERVRSGGHVAPHHEDLKQKYHVSGEWWTKKPVWPHAPCCSFLP